MRSLSDVAPTMPGASPRSATMRASSAVLMRFPLWPSARLPNPPIDRKDGWAFSQVHAPVVEYRVCPMARWPRSEFSVASSKTWATRPSSL